jgi:hypothetical protein
MNDIDMRVFAVLLLMLLLAFVKPYPLVNNPWNQEQCLNLYGPSPMGKDGIPITKLHWDSGSIEHMSPGIIQQVVDPWPEPMEQRSSSQEYFKALGSPKPPHMASTLSYGPLPSNLHVSKWKQLLGNTHASSYFKSFDDGIVFSNFTYVILSEAHRMIYLSNLKAGSTTITSLMSSKTQKALKSCGMVPTSSLEALFKKISLKECAGKCQLSCNGFANLTRAAHHILFQLHTNDIPDELLEKYLVFSFGKFEPIDSLI